MIDKALEGRFWEKVEKTESCWLWAASTNGGGYGQIREGGSSPRVLLAHRVSYELANGEIPAGKQIDFLCHNRACVNPAHMRLVTNKQNAENLCGPTKRNTTGSLGVSWDATRSKYLAAVKHNYRFIYAGRFDSFAEAEAAVIAKRLELFTHNEADKAGHVHDESCAHPHVRDRTKQ